MNRDEFIKNLTVEINKELAVRGERELHDATLEAVVRVLGTAVFAVAHMVENVAIATKTLEAIELGGGLN